MKGLRNKSALKQGEKTDIAFPQITLSRACNNLHSVLQRFTVHHWWSHDFNSNEAWFYIQNERCCFLDPHPSTLSCARKFIYCWKSVIPEMQRCTSGSKWLLSKLLCYRIDTASEQGLHFPGCAQASFARFAQCVPYIQNELQCTLISQNILLEDTLSQALPSQKTCHVLAAHHRRAASHLL